MASYTITPLPIIDNLHNHDGLMVIGVATLFLILVVWAYRASANQKTYFANYALAYIVIMGYPAYISFTTGEIITPKNEVIIAELQGFWGENHKETRQSGKTYTTVDVHNQFVVYKTPDGNISFKMHPNTPYPEKAILYRN